MNSIPHAVHNLKIQVYTFISRTVFYLKCRRYSHKEATTKPFKSMSDFLVTVRPQALQLRAWSPDQVEGRILFLLLPAPPSPLNGRRVDWRRGCRDGRRENGQRESSWRLQHCGACTDQAGTASWFGSRFSLSAQFICDSQMLCPVVHCLCRVSVTLQTGAPSFQGAYFL